MKHKRKILIILALVIMLIAGCSKGGNSNSNSNKTNANRETTSDLDIYTLESAKMNKHEAEISEFDLGKKEYISKAGKTMPYNIRGIIGVPDGEGPFPLILITHGSHSNDDESKRFDTGFDYLVRDLAENGFIAVSMDMSKPYIWKYGDNDDCEKSLPIADDHINSLILANEGNNPGYKTDLKGKIDFDKLALIGHSRGGETIFEIASDQAKKGVNIKAVLSIAPTFLFSDREWPECDAAIIVPEYDGDIISLDGFSIYRALSAEGKGNYSATFLMKANHNFFNRNISLNDAEMLRNERDLSLQLTREEQENFIMNFAVDFFNASLLGNSDNFINSNMPQPNKMYGFDVKTLYKSNQSVDLIDVSTANNFKAIDAKVEATVDSWFYKYDKVLIDTVTSGDESYMTRPLINIKWENTNSSVIIAPKVQDFSKHNTLTLNMVIDSADELNKKNASQQFTVELKDIKGNISRIVLPENLNALGYTPGKIDSTELEDLVIRYWSALSPISCINLPLDKFQNIDLEHIESISLVFDKTNSGSVYIDSIYLQ